MVELQVEGILAEEPAIEIVPDRLIVDVFDDLLEYVGHLCHHDLPMLGLFGLDHALLHEVVSIVPGGVVLDVLFHEPPHLLLLLLVQSIGLGEPYSVGPGIVVLAVE